MLEGVLQQLVNCFLEASGGSLTFSHRLFISTQKSAWVELKTNLKHRECVFFHFGVCWNSLSTASWIHLQEISWIVQKWKFFSPLFFILFINWQMKSIGTNVGRCAAAARQLLPECICKKYHELFKNGSFFHPYFFILFINWQMKSIGTHDGRCTAAARR